MGRRPLSEDQKRQQICARFSPEEREVINERATRLGQSPNVVVAELATMFIDVDDRTLELFRAIADDIKSLPMLQTGKPWHQTIAKWGAVKELLYRSTIEQFRPEKWTDDPETTAALKLYLAKKREQSEAAQRLRDAGLPALDEPSAAKPAKGGLFGGLQNLLGGRSSLRLLLAEIDDQETRALITSMVEELERLDKEVEEAHSQFQALVSHYDAAEMEGRDATRAHLKQIAARNMAAHAETNVRHLLGLWT